MAVYEYRCKACGLDIEIDQAISEDAKTLLYCPFCERMRSVSRIISHTNFILKGDAWAKTGYSGSKK